MGMTRSAESEMRVGRSLCLFFVTLSVVAALNLAAQQASPQAPSAEDQSAFAGSAVYDVASIRKFTTDGGPMSMSMRVEPDGLTVTHMQIKSLICMAYKVFGYQVSGGPGWVESDLYDVHAKMDEATMAMFGKLSPDQAKQARQHMAQSLLADRFKLVAHHETRLLPGFVLVVVKGGSKLHEAKPDDTYSNGIKRQDGSPAGKGMMNMGFDGGAMTLTAQGVSIDTLAKHLSGQLQSKVDNETGLKGDYDLALRFSMDEGRAAAPNPSGESESLSENSAPPIFTALQEQLGLKLESKKVPVDVIVIDHIEAPSEN
jgi:uncharacterized protein (TIGR03435 family)